MADNLTKAQLVEAVATASDITKVAAATAVNTVFDAISGQVAKGGKVVLVGFGTFFQRARKARTGRNPATGETIKIAASKSLAFKGSKAAAAKPAKKKAAKKK